MGMPYTYLYLLSVYQAPGREQELNNDRINKRVILDRKALNKKDDEYKQVGHNFIVQTGALPRVNDYSVNKA